MAKNNLRPQTEAEKKAESKRLAAAAKKNPNRRVVGNDEAWNTTGRQAEDAVINKREQEVEHGPSGMMGTINQQAQAPPPPPTSNEDAWAKKARDRQADSPEGIQQRQNDIAQIDARLERDRLRRGMTREQAQKDIELERAEELAAARERIARRLRARVMAGETLEGQEKEFLRMWGEKPPEGKRSNDYAPETRAPAVAPPDAIDDFIADDIDRLPGFTREGDPPAPAKPRWLGDKHNVVPPVSEQTRVEDPATPKEEADFIKAFDAGANAPFDTGVEPEGPRSVGAGLPDIDIGSFTQEGRTDGKVIDWNKVPAGLGFDPETGVGWSVADGMRAHAIEDPRFTLIEGPERRDQDLGYTLVKGSNNAPQFAPANSPESYFVNPDQISEEDRAFFDRMSSRLLETQRFNDERERGIIPDPYAVKQPTGDVEGKDNAAAIAAAGAPTQFSPAPTQAEIAAAVKIEEERSQALIAAEKQRLALEEAAEKQRLALEEKVKTDPTMRIEGKGDYSRYPDEVELWMARNNPSYEDRSVPENLEINTIAGRQQRDMLSGIVEGSSIADSNGQSQFERWKQNGGKWDVPYLQVSPEAIKAAQQYYLEFGKPKPSTSGFQGGIQGGSNDWDSIGSGAEIESTTQADIEAMASGAPMYSTKSELRSDDFNEEEWNKRQEQRRADSLDRRDVSRRNASIRAVSRRDPQARRLHLERVNQNLPPHLRITPEEVGLPSNSKVGTIRAVEDFSDVSMGTSMPGEYLSSPQGLVRVGESHEKVPMMRVSGGQAVPDADVMTLEDFRTHVTGTERRAISDMIRSAPGSDGFAKEQRRISSSRNQLRNNDDYEEDVKNEQLAKLKDDETKLHYEFLQEHGPADSTPRELEQFPQQTDKEAQQAANTLRAQIAAMDAKREYEKGPDKEDGTVFGNGPSSPSVDWTPPWTFITFMKDSYINLPGRSRDDAIQQYATRNELDSGWVANATTWSTENDIK